MQSKFEKKMNSRLIQVLFQGSLLCAEFSQFSTVRLSKSYQRTIIRGLTFCMNEFYNIQTIDCRYTPLRFDPE